MKSNKENKNLTPLKYLFIITWKQAKKSFKDFSKDRVVDIF